MWFALGNMPRSVSGTAAVRRGGALRHLVRASRFGAPVRPTIAHPKTGGWGHCLADAPRRTVPITPTRDPTGGTWGVGHGTGDGHSS